MNDTDLIDWINWYVQGDDTVTITFEEEDGGLLLHLSSGGSFLGTDVRDCVFQAAEKFPMPEV
jgi:hypothetical protein